jgi:hypothetical protein
MTQEKNSLGKDFGFPTSSQNNARKHVFGGMGLEFGRWRWALVECKNKQQPANFGTKTTAYFGEKPSQWATFANLIFTEPNPAAPHTLNEKPNPEKKSHPNSSHPKFAKLVVNGPHHALT